MLAEKLMYPLGHAVTHKNTYEAILVVGYGNSGASVLVDLLKECDGFLCPEIEFYVAQHPDGVIGLENALVSSWSDFGPDWAIRRFNELIDVLARPATRFRFGLNYSELLSPDFKEISNKYINRLVDFRHSGYFYFRSAEMSGLTHSLLYLVGIMRTFVRQVKRFDYLSTLSFSLNMMLVKLTRRLSSFSTIMACPKNTFFNITRQYFEELFRALDQGDKAHKVVLDQGTTAYQPARVMNYFHSARTIIIDRDPRDIFISAIASMYLPLEVNEFIRWHKMTREMSIQATEGNERIIRINFEELIFDYQSSCRRIFCFLGCEDSIHVDKGKYFIPEISAKGTGKWKTYPLQSQISLIEKELSDYLYNGPRKLEE